MFNNIGWLVYVVKHGHRRYVCALDCGEPVFTFDLAKALYREEYEARELALIVDRQFNAARLLYVPASVRRELGVVADLWGGYAL